MDMKPTGKAAKINVAAGVEPKAGHQAPAKASSPGHARSADMVGAMEGKPTDRNPLHGAIKYLGASATPKQTKGLP